MPIPGTDIEVADIVYRDGPNGVQLVAAGGEWDDIVGDIAIGFQADAPLDMMLSGLAVPADAQPQMAARLAADLGMDCAIEDVPLMFFQGEMTEDGTLMSFTSMMAVTGPDRMVGIFHMSVTDGTPGMAMYGYRPLVMEQLSEASYQGNVGVAPVVEEDTAEPLTPEGPVPAAIPIFEGLAEQDLDRG